MGCGASGPEGEQELAVRVLVPHPIPSARPLP